jgi:hypothetical protein
MAATPVLAAGPGAWSVGTVVEPDSVEEVRAAMVATADGFTLAVAREPGGSRVLGVLRLPPADKDFLDDALGVQIQIDDGARLEPTRLGGGLKSSTFFLWDGVGEPVVGPLRDLMEAKSAIATVLGVPEEVTPEARDLALARQEAVERCLGESKAKDRDRCLERLAACAAEAEADRLRDCIASAKK